MATRMFCSNSEDKKHKLEKKKKDSKNSPSWLKLVRKGTLDAIKKIDSLPQTSVSFH